MDTDLSLAGLYYMLVSMRNDLCMFGIGGKIQDILESSAYFIAYLTLLRFTGVW